ncbi:MAG: monovalent cation/H(+) antiporter subunit G [Chlamydiota bacterium]
MTTIITPVFVFIGVLFVFIGGLGILRLPDALCRSHAISKALTLGVSLMLIGLLIETEKPVACIKILLAIFFLFLSMPLSGHIFALYAVKKQNTDY